MIIFRQWHQQIIVTFHLRFTGDFLRIKRGVPGIKYIAHEPVQLLAVIHAKVMRARFVIDVSPQIIPPIQQAENRCCRINQRRQRMTGREAAAIVRVVGQQRRAIGKHSSKVRVIRVHREIVGRLFRVAQILAVPARVLKLE